ncbi:glycosyltransferase family 39 protein [Labrenzia sp. VG12]|uniref:glycosyltransferase family 39 protein n=1 Tax=Labrenzia sp. VG12 TaxID=2021862 RepID=UPI0012FDBBC9|nr:glycosyltransferase family 39 protein [Labrenzia sp. VG12]
MKQGETGQLQTGWRWETLVLLLILVGTVLLRFPDLDRTSLWYDEAVSWDQSKGTFTELLTAVAADNYPPLHNIVLWLSMPALGDSETALRLPSALLGLVAVLLMYPLASMMAGRSAGLAAAALLAVSPFHIWYSTEARMYALLAATGLAFLLATLKLLQRASGRWQVALAVSGTLFLYSHIYAVLGFAAVGLVCGFFALVDIFRNKSVSGSNAFKACLAMAVSALLFLPWLLILASRVRSVAEEGFWIAYPDAAFLKGMIFSISGSLFLFWLLLALALVGLLQVLIQPSRHGPTPFSSRGLLVCIAYALGPPLLAYFYSVLVQPILFDRYLIAAWPGLLLLAAIAAQRLLPQIAPLALVATALLLSLPELKFTLQTKIRPEWRLIAEDYQSQRGPDDRLVLYKGFAAPALSYYLRTPEAFATVEKSDDLKTLDRKDKWLLIVHSNDAETTSVLKAFNAEESAVASQRFGWGASGLRLIKPRSAD